MTLAAFRLGVNPPNPPATNKVKIIGASLLEQYPRQIAFITQAINIPILFMDILLLLLLQFKGSFLNTLAMGVCPVSTSLLDLEKLSLTFTTGITMVCVGAVIRLWCFKSLGILFTYEVTIKPNHKLISSGPYSIVRHPGYTAIFLVKIGGVMAALSRNTYLDVCGVMSTSTIARWGFRLWAVWVAYMVYGLLQRGDVEDAKLREKFGKEWEDFHARVPYKFIPKII